MSKRNLELPALKVPGWGTAFAAGDVELPIDPTIADEPGFVAARPLALEAVLVLFDGVLAAT